MIRRAVATAALLAAALTSCSFVRPESRPFLECVKQHESRGDYTVVSANGLYHGAYQFLQSTWNVTAEHGGRPELIGLAPELEPPATQDWMAQHLLDWQGTSPWNGSGC